MFLAGHPNHQLVFMRIWQIEPSYLTDAFRDFYDENPLNITRILDVAQDLKVCASPYIRHIFHLENISRSLNLYSTCVPLHLHSMWPPLPLAANISI